MDHPPVTESRAALSLFAVLVVAKALMVHRVAASIWAPFVYLWQDVLIALAFFGLARLVRRPGPIWTLYAALVAYVALNVPVAREVASPLTPAMWRAARGPLADSIAHGLTRANLASLAIVLLVAAFAPWAVARLRVSVWSPLVAGAIVWIATGLAATPSVDTRGEHRNAIGALVPLRPPATASGPVPADWRASPMPGEPRGIPDPPQVTGTAAGANVLLIALESAAARYLGLYGAARDPMPNLTRLANRGYVVDDAYAVYPESIKGLFSTLCSRYPAYDTATETYAGVPCTSLARLLKDAGYRTALFHSGRFDYLGMRAVIDGRGFDVLEDAGAIGGNVNSSFGIDETSSVDHMLEWLDGLNAGERFFITYLPIAGHHPYATERPGPFSGGSEETRYLNALHEGDAALGRLLDGLATRGLDRSTLIVAFGDHGEAFGQHPGNAGHAQFIYDENIRVPLLITSPKGPKSPESPTGPGSPTSPESALRIRRVASLIDVAPTVLDLLGLPRVPEYQGTSVFAPGPRMSLFYTDYALGWLGLRDGCWKYLLQMDTRRSSLYDVCADPGETVDRSSAEPTRVSVYQERVQAWSARVRAETLAVR